MLDRGFPVGFGFRVMDGQCGFGFGVLDRGFPVRFGFRITDGQCGFGLVGFHF
jgi:hypothetical protein